MLNMFEGNSSKNVSENEDESSRCNINILPSTLSLGVEVAGVRLCLCGPVDNSQTCCRSGSAFVLCMYEYVITAQAHFLGTQKI